MVGGVTYHNPPDDTAPDAPRIGRRTAKVLVRAVRVALLYLLAIKRFDPLRIGRRTAAVLAGLIAGVRMGLFFLLVIHVLGPWFAGLLNIGLDIAILGTLAAVGLVGVSMMVYGSRAPTS